MLPFEIDGRSYPLDQLKLELPSLDLIAWLSHQPLYPKVFWQEKESGITRAAVGNLLSFPHVPNLSTPLDIRLYGGMRFALKRHNDETWRGFPQTCFWLPQIEISQENGKTVALLHYLNEKSSLTEAQHLDFFAGPLDYSLPSLLNRQEVPDFPQWQKSVAQVLEEIASSRIDKCVLARKSVLHFASPLSSWPLLAHLKEKAKHATVFAFQLASNVCFLGATPEKLFQRENNFLTADAIASTRPRGKTPEEDFQFELELLSEGKEQREFKFVSEFLKHSLKPFSEEINWAGPDRVLKASHVQHLYNRLSATLKSGISTAQLLETLHPTPALGGFPKAAALSLLKNIETFDRGWYGAPIGVICPSGASLHVAIRSALIRERALHLFAGTGLVQGSVAEREWEELEQKIRPFTELFV